MRSASSLHDFKRFPVKNGNSIAHFLAAQTAFKRGDDARPPAVHLKGQIPMTPAALLSDRQSFTETDPDELRVGATETLPTSLLQLLFNTLQVGLAIVDEEGILIGHNAAWSRLIVSDLPDTAGLARGSNVVRPV